MDEYSMYVCPECKKVFKVKGNDKNVKCSQCSESLLYMNIDLEAWNELNTDERVKMRDGFTKHNQKKSNMIIPNVEENTNIVDDDSEKPEPAHSKAKKSATTSAKSKSKKKKSTTNKKSNTNTKKKALSIEEIIEIVHSMPSCIVKKCPSDRAITEIIKKIMIVREYLAKSETMFVCDHLAPNKKKYFDDWFDYSYVKKGKISNGYRDFAISAMNKTSYYRGKDIVIFVVDELSNVGSPSFDKELWRLLKNDTRGRIKFIGFTQMEMVSQVKMKTSLDLLEVYDYEVFKEFLTGKTSFVKGNNEDKISSLEIDYDNMTDGHTFEKYCAEILQKNGFENIVVTSGSGDQGIDILCRKEEVKYGIQCKCYSKDIGNKAVQEAYSGAQFYNCHVPVVLTNRDFTPAAREAAEKTNVLLWNRQKLELLILNSKK